MHWAFSIFFLSRNWSNFAFSRSSPARINRQVKMRARDLFICDRSQWHDLSDGVDDRYANYNVLESKTIILNPTRKRCKRAVKRCTMRFTQTVFHSILVHSCFVPSANCSCCAMSFTSLSERNNETWPLNSKIRSKTMLHVPVIPRGAIFSSSSSPCLAFCLLHFYAKYLMFKKRSCAIIAPAN